MKSIIQLPAIIFVALCLFSCRHITKPSLEEMQKEKITLLLVLKANDAVTDVFGDSLSINHRYYVYTSTHQLVPLSYIAEGHSTSVQQKLSILGLLGNNGSDTIDIGIGRANSYITVRQFRIKDIKLSPPQLR